MSRDRARTASSERSRSSGSDRAPKPERSKTGRSRAEEKSRTRRALLDGALDLLETRSIDNLGIREVTRAAGVAPAAFYRHFDRIDDLGLVLVDEAFTTLRRLIRDTRDEVAGGGDLIERSTAALVAHIKANPASYRFIAREQSSSVVAVRLAIRREIRLFATELATDLARLPGIDRWPTRDLVMLADLIVSLMVETARRLLDALDEGPERVAEVEADAVVRLRYLSVGAAAWRPR